MPKGTFRLQENFVKKIKTVRHTWLPKKRLQETHDIQQLTVSEGPFTTSATGAVKLLVLDRFFLNLQRQGPTLSRLYNAEVKILLCSHHL